MSTIKIRTKLIDGNTQLRTLITHPMETGRALDPKTRQPIPPHFIQELTVSRNGQVIVTCRTGMSISKDPYFAFLLKGGRVGDKITVRWLDNLGKFDSEDHLVK